MLIKCTAVKESLNSDVINSSNINKTNNLNLSSFLNSLNTKHTTTYGVGNPGPDLGQAKKCEYTIYWSERYLAIVLSFFDLRPLTTP
jgi:hypothetical protein